MEREKAQLRTYRHADDIDGHKEEVDPGSDLVDANGPDLGHNNGADGASRGGEIETASAERGWEDLESFVSPRDRQMDTNREVELGLHETYLGAVYPSGRPESHAVAQGVDEDEDDTGVIGGAVQIIRVRQRQRAVDLVERSMSAQPD